MRTTVVIEMLSGFCLLVTLANDVFGISAVAMLRVAGDMFACGVYARTTIGRAPSSDNEVNACG